MTSEQPSLFDQLTPSDTLRDDLDWLDSLQETKPSKPPRKPKNRRSDRKKHDAGPVRHDDARETTPAPPAEPAETTVLATVPDTAALPPVSENTDTPTVPETIVEAESDRTREQPELPISSDAHPMPPVPLPPQPAARVDDTVVPDETEDTLTSMNPIGRETPSDVPPAETTRTMPAMSLQDVADPDGASSDDARTMVWVRRGLIIALAFIILLVLFAIMGSHADTARQKATAEQLQTSMSQLSTWTGKAKTTIRQADRIGLDDTDDIDSLRRLIDSNGKLMRTDRTGLSEDESERLSAKADKATKRTRTLTNKVSRLVKDKPLTDARNKCHTALDKASKASNEAKPSDDATRTAKTSLDKLITQARKLGSKTTIDTWNDMAAKLDKARESLSRALDEKAKADEEAKRQSEAQEQQQAQQQQQATPTPTPAPTPRYRGSSGGSGSTTVPRGNSGGSSNNGGTGNNSGGSSGGNSGGWYVPPETTDNSLPNNDSSL